MKNPTRLQSVVRCALLLHSITIPLALAAGPKPPSSAKYLEFPKGFQWCVATAGYMMEGENPNADWWNWSKENWGVELGRGIDHWNRVDEDIGLLKSIHVKTYRFSVEWSRIEPQPGRIDRDAVAHYRDEVMKIKAAGIRPVLNLHVWVFPQWVRDLGGFEWPGLPEAFAKYATLVAQEIGPDVDDWLTLNEPMVNLTLGYLADRQPPNLRGQSRPIDALVRPLRGLLRTHAAGYWALKDAAKAQGRAIRVGLVNHLRVFQPSQALNPLDALGAAFFDHAFNWLVPETIETGYFRWPAGFAFLVNFFFPKLLVDEAMPEVKGTQDYFGMNYYTRDVVHVDLSKDVSTWIHMVGGQTGNENLYPAGFYRLLKEVHRRLPRLPILITENGINDATDLLRPKYIEDHLFAVHAAIQEGVPVEGYCHWTLMDNFEWSLGWVPKFGLFHVDLNDNFKRTPRPSAFQYADIAKRNGLWATPYDLTK